MVKLRRGPERSAGETHFLLTSQICVAAKGKKPWASGLEASLERLLGVPRRDQQRAPKHHQRPAPPRPHLPGFSLFKVSLIQGVKLSFSSQSYVKDNKPFDIAQRNTFEGKEFRDFPGGPVVKTALLLKGVLVGELSSCLPRGRAIQKSL